MLVSKFLFSNVFLFYLFGLFYFTLLGFIFAHGHLQVCCHLLEPLPLPGIYQVKSNVQCFNFEQQWNSLIIIIIISLLDIGLSRGVSFTASPPLKIVPPSHRGDRVLHYAVSTPVVFGCFIKGYFQKGLDLFITRQLPAYCQYQVFKFFKS